MIRSIALWKLVDLIFLDFNKVFDIISHGILLCGLSSCETKVSAKLESAADEEERGLVEDSTFTADGAVSSGMKFNKIKCSFLYLR